MPVAPSSYYARKARPPSARALSDAARTVEIERLPAENYGVYGVRKMHALLAGEGQPMARCTVHRLMRGAGLRGVSRARSPRTTFGAKTPDGRPDLVKRNFTAETANRVWVADLTYVRTFAGWAYAAFVLDVHSRRIVGWQVSTSLHTEPRRRQCASTGDPARRSDAARLPLPLLGLLPGTPYPRH